MLIIVAKNNFDGNIGTSRKGVIFFETFFGGLFNRIHNRSLRRVNYNFPPAPDDQSQAGVTRGSTSFRSLGKVQTLSEPRNPLAA